MFKTKHIILYPMILMITFALSSCKEQVNLEHPVAGPLVIHSNTLRYSKDHPQLQLLALSKVTVARETIVELPARIIWNEERTQRVFSAFSGRVKSIKADVGQEVKPGQVLAELASAEFGTAQADAQRATADQTFAQQVFDRQQRLFEIGVIAKKELDQAFADLQRSKLEFERAQSRVKVYESSSDIDLSVGLRSAISGVVVERNINPGQELRSENNQTPIFVVSDPSTLWVQIDAQESDLPGIRVGDLIDVKVSSLGDQVFQGRIAVIGEQIDSITRSIKLRAVVSNPGRILKSEMLAKAVYRRKAASLLEVPTSAVFLDGPRHFVFVQYQTGEYQLRAVETVGANSERTLIKSGLEQGESVVSQNGLLLLRELKNSTAAANARSSSN